MPTSEQSFQDRHGRAEVMHSLIAGFVPAFNPPDAGIKPAGFKTYVDSLKAANLETTEKEFALADQMGQRRTLADNLKETALQVKNYVTSNRAWKAWHTTVSRAADKVRGQVLSRKKKPGPVPGEGEPPTSPRARQGARTQQGFSDLFRHFEALIAAVKKVTGYTAEDGTGLTLEELQDQSDAYSEKLKDTADAEASYTEAVRVRLALYNNDEGLNYRMKAVKRAVRAAYGNGSPEDLAVRAVKV